MEFGENISTHAEGGRDERGYYFNQLKDELKQIRQKASDLEKEIKEKKK